MEGNGEDDGGERSKDHFWVAGNMEVPRMMCLHGEHIVCSPHRFSGLMSGIGLAWLFVGVLRHALLIKGSLVYACRRYTVKQVSSQI